MECIKCKSQNPNGSKFCKMCGAKFDEASENIDHEPVEQVINERVKKNKNYINIVRFGIGGVFVLFFLYNFVFSTLNESAIDLNESAIDSYDLGGDPEVAIRQLEQAVDDSYGDEYKIETLKNLAILYTSELKDREALNTFRKALALSKNGSLNFYFISAEIAKLEHQPSVAIYNFEKALTIDPNDPQVHNGLGLLYLGVDDQNVEYVDYNKALYHNKKAFEFGEGLSDNTAKENIALSHFFLEDYSAALPIFLEIYYLQSSPLTAYFIGLSYLGLENFVEAERYLQIASNGDVTEAQTVLDLL